MRSEDLLEERKLIFLAEKGLTLYPKCSKSSFFWVEEMVEPWPEDGVMNEYQCL